MCIMNVFIELHVFISTVFTLKGSHIDFTYQLTFLSA